MAIKKFKDLGNAIEETEPLGPAVSKEPRKYIRLKESAPSDVSDMLECSDTQAKALRRYPDEVLAKLGVTRKMYIPKKQGKILKLAELQATMDDWETDADTKIKALSDLAGMVKDGENAAQGGQG